MRDTSGKRAPGELGGNAGARRLKLPALELPHGWSVVDTGGPGPFVTRATLERPDGILVEWFSRPHRKNRAGRDTGRRSTWWAPRAIGWWVGVLFGVGAICFALGSAPGYTIAVGGGIDGLTFFIGSIWFTTAAFLQYLETANTGRTLSEVDGRRRFHLLTWEPRRIDWWASSVQLAGTLFFNVSTFKAMQASLSAAQVDKFVWRPDAYGSICFLVASTLAWMEVGHGILSWRPRSLSWWIVALNLMGSIAFGVSAVAAYVVPADGEAVSVALSNLGTFVGAVCFFAGAILLLPERTLGSDEPQKSSKGHWGRHCPGRPHE